MKVLNLVVLNTDLPDFHLKSGDTGTIVFIHGNGESFEVEFATLRGDTLVVVTLNSDQVRPVNDREVAHVRSIEISD